MSFVTEILAFTFAYPKTNYTFHGTTQEKQWVNK